MSSASSAALLFGCEEVFRDEVEGIAGTPEKKQKLVVVLETAGVTLKSFKGSRRRFDTTTKGSSS